MASNSKKVTLSIVYSILCVFCFSSSKASAGFRWADRDPVDNYAHIAYIAVKHCNIEILEFLVGNLVDVKYGDANKTTLLHYSMGRSCQKVKEILIEKGADVNAIESATGFTPLHKAAMEGDIRGVRLLLEKGADPYIKEKFNGLMPLDLAMSTLRHLEGKEASPR
ncbi:ankyrin repeat domain-containing protein [Wolbachia endosymbiont of Pentalonia nigronervosa]|uniref:ankyrin repeat domain-containing protein n=1 Tax=Wolbachia endosymbiont of Pentalonia nigronervosa TaxID=1301914 RepID=UPI00165FB7F9|nr:ankyrin repeat domain-containing protein [Wolbachia endosymbiont of Pentalonia nigronervosa]MBD0392137.1 ankyrin repeat domain-containing protein [Wolbachia endosymbiont of Pentalonia nigronervosa]